MHLRIVFQGSVPKDDSPGSANDDSFAGDESSQRFAVADGASESYASGRWSRLVADAWVRGGAAISRAGLNRLISEYEEACAPETLSWSKLGAFERGSFATLLGVSMRGDRARIVAFGDSIVVGAPIEGATLSFPYTFPEEFDSRPHLLSTKASANAAVLHKSSVHTCVTVWPLAPGSTLLLMTDALGQWTLRRNADATARGTLEAITTCEELRDFVSAERAKGAMRRDDTTLIHLRAEAP
jgi:hypothetical protein